MFPPLIPPSPENKASKSAFLKSSINSKQREERLQKQREVDAERAKESVIQRARREKKEQIEHDRKVRDAQFLYEARKNLEIKERELRQKRRKLVNKIEIRPHDKKSALSLIDVAYELGDYFQVCTVIKRSILKFPELRTFDVYLKLGRCFLRRWKKDGSKADLLGAYDAYKEALNNPGVLTRPLATPFPYFEFAGICARLEKAQMALDVLGAIMARWEDDYNILMLCQYIVAQISLVNGQINAAHEIYKDLTACPQVVEPLIIFDKSHHVDSIPMVSQYLTSILCQIELACLQHRLGDKKMSIRMLSEAFSRQESLGQIKLEDDTVIDIRNGETSFERWAGSHNTYKYLGDFFAKNMHNLAIAAELYGIASEVYSKNVSEIENLSKIEKSLFCGLILDRGECLAEMGAHADAEFCGHFAFSILPIDPVVTGRSARCCQRIHEKNEEITLMAVGVFKAVNLMQRILRRKVAYRRKLARQALNDYATIINSAIRMALVRNRLAGDFLEITSCGRIGKRIHSFRGLWKTGKQELHQWIEFWNISCNIIQRGLWRWFIRRKNTRVIRGITTCKRIWKGQRVRRAIREKISLIQEQLDQGSLSSEQNKSGLYFDNFLVHRLTSGITVITNDQNNVTLKSSDEQLSPISSSKQILSKTPPPFAKVFDSDYSLGMKSKVSRRSAKDVTADSGLSLFKSTSYNSPSTTSNNLKSSPMKSSSAPSSLVKSNMPILANSIASSQSIFGDKSSALVNVEELDTYVQLAEKTGEDVISMISVKSVMDDNAYKWIPFALLPEEAVVRIMTCTILTITSTSFSTQDSMRIVYVCRKYPHLWSNIKSLLLFGTKLGAHGGVGIINLIKLGFNNMNTLSLGYTNIPSSFGSYLGNMLMDLKLNVKPSSLTKLYIENEPRFGIIGTNDLVKSLQYNTSLRILSIRRCGLDHRAVTSLARFVSLSRNLEILNVNDNNFTYHDCRQLLHAVANKGVKGNFRGLHCIGTQPPLKPLEIEKLFEEGVNINVNVISGELDAGGVGFRKELAYQKLTEEKNGKDFEAKKKQIIDSYENEMCRLGTIKDLEKVSMEGTKSYKAIYF
jgi:tetratricopeptide (TPR) repeat protein